MTLMHGTMKTLTEPVRATLPVAPYIGGKRNLARRLIARIETIPHSLYAEPFVGMGGVFLRRRHRPRAEVINDLGRDVSGLFRILQRHHVAFLDHIRHGITSRAEFDRLSRTDPDTLTDIERAARFLYLQRTAFGGKVTGRTFGLSPGWPGGFDPTQLGSLLDALHTRLAGVVIECLPWQTFVQRYDRPETLFYLDPPYHGTEQVYGKGMFSEQDFVTLAQVLASIKGTFLLTLNDTPGMRAIFADLAIETVATSYSVGRETASRAPRHELIITNRQKA